MSLSSKGSRDRVGESWRSGLPSCPNSSIGLTWLSEVEEAAPLILGGLPSEREGCLG